MRVRKGYDKDNKSIYSLIIIFIEERRGNESKKQHLPLWGMGPFYVIAILCLTVFAIFFSHSFGSGRIKILRIPFLFMGIGFVLAGVMMRIQAVFFSKLTKHIKENHLVTYGVYAWVRNPIYSAFLLLCTGFLFIEGNIYFLFLPLLYWSFLTVLMKYSEEKWLLEKYGEEYKEYQRHVNRCWP